MIYVIDQLLFLLDEDDQKKKKKKKNKAVTEDAGLTFGLQPRIGVESLQRVKKTSIIPKQIVRSTQPNGSYPMNENIVKDTKDVRQVTLIMWINHITCFDIFCLVFALWAALPMLKMHKGFND